MILFICSDTAFGKPGKGMSMVEAKAAKDESAKSGKAATVDAKAEKVSTPKMSSKFFPTPTSSAGNMLIFF